MKYIEELDSGDIFTLDDKYFLCTADFKSNGKRLVYSITDGFANWLEGATIVEQTNIYTMDDKNNIAPIKQYKVENHVPNH